MTNFKPHDRWEASTLAAAMAVAGTLFLFDKIAPLMREGVFSFNTILHTAPVLLTALGVSLFVAEQNGATPGADRTKEDRNG